MKYNAVLDLSLSDGGIAAGTSYTLATANETAIEGQTVFTLDGDIDGKTVLLFFLDGVKWEPVDLIGSLTSDKTYFFDNTEITILGGATALAVASVLYVASGSATMQDEPVTLAEVKDWSKIDISEHDTLLTNLITAARELCEDMANISLINRTVTATILNQLGRANLPYGPVISFTSLTDEDGEALEITEYTIDGQDFKSIREDFCTPVTAVYTAGYSSVPQKLKHAILYQVDWMYNNRGSDKGGDMAPDAKNILRRYKQST